MSENLLLLFTIFMVNISDFLLFLGYFKCLHKCSLWRAEKKGYRKYRKTKDLKTVVKSL